MSGMDRLVLRLSVKERDSLELRAKYMGFPSIPAYVRHVLETYKTQNYTIKELKEKVIICENEIRAMKEAERRIEGVNELIVAQFRKTIIEMGTEKDRLLTEQAKIETEKLVQEVQTLVAELGVSDRVEEGLRVIKNFKEIEKDREVLQATYNRLNQEHVQLTEKLSGLEDLYEKPFAIFKIIWRWFCYWCVPRK